MKYISYLVYVPITVLVGSWIIYLIRDIFDIVYYQEMESLIYGFNPKGMPEFNWKVNLLIWGFEITLVVGGLGLVSDEITKRNINARRILPVPIAVANCVAVAAIYVVIGILSNYSNHFFYLPRFFLDTVSDALSKKIEPVGLPIIISGLFHGAVFSVSTFIFYLRGRKRQLWIFEKEIAHRKEREIQA